jgi:hypothetical protein
MIAHSGLLSTVLLIRSSSSIGDLDVTLSQGSCSAVRKLLPVILVFSSLTGAGCDSPGTGSDKVQDRVKLVDQLSKGARPDPKGKAVDDQGIKFRKKD